MKKGYTLIELIVVLFIISILASVGIMSYKVLKSPIDIITVKGDIADIQNLISYGKYYCRKECRTGEIVVKRVDNEISFVDTTYTKEKVKTVNLTKELRVVNDMTLKVSNIGHVQSDTIRLKDSNNNNYRITIATGVDTVNIYQE